MKTAPILVVDDEPQNLELLNQILRDDYKLVFAKSGEKALQSVEKHNPALILLDVEMPGIDGYAVCEQLKKNPKTSHIPVIFVTSHSQFREEMKGFEVGAADYIVKPFVPEIVRLRVENHLSLVRAAILEKSYREAIKMLSCAGHYNDNDTGLHIWRMAAYARLLAKRIGLDEEFCINLEQAALLHDTGKIGIPDGILSKPSQLNKDEWATMKRHPIIGHEILSESDAFVFQLASEICLHHHEKWDGSGYPHGLQGEEITLPSRIVAIADVFDALTSKRPYKKAWTLNEAYNYLEENSGKHFDPALVDVFCKCRDEIQKIRTLYPDYPDENKHLTSAS